MGLSKHFEGKWTVRNTSVGGRWVKSTKIVSLGTFIQGQDCESYLFKVGQYFAVGVKAFINRNGFLERELQQVCMDRIFDETVEEVVLFLDLRTRS